MSLKKDVAEVEALVKAFMDLGDITLWEERIIYLEEIEAKLLSCRERQDLFASREEVSKCWLFQYKSDWKYPTLMIFELQCPSKLTSYCHEDDHDFSDNTDA